MNEFYEDVTVSCRDCKVDFLYTGGEQRFFVEKGFSAPTRCKACREARKAEKATTGGPSVQTTPPRNRPAPEVINLRTGSGPVPAPSFDQKPPKEAGRKPQKGRRSRQDYEDWGLQTKVERPLR